MLVIASAGWVFDTFEGQIFNITRGQMLTELLGAANRSDANRWGDLFLAVFLLGGTLGGILFGTLADRYGRKRTMAATILIYSIFSGLTYFATELWHVALLRFLVAMGVGGEWSVAASLVAEEFPARARARASGIFHATSILGTWLAAIAGLWVGSHWRYAYLIGVLPALLVFWVRSRLEEPTRWLEVESMDRPLGSFRDLFGTPIWARRACLGIVLAAIGLGTFWGVTVAGQDLAVEMLLQEGYSKKGDAQQQGKFAYGIVQTIGGGFWGFYLLDRWRNGWGDAVHSSSCNPGHFLWFLRFVSYPAIMLSFSGPCPSSGSSPLEYMPDTRSIFLSFFRVIFGQRVWESVSMADVCSRLRCFGCRGN